LPNLKGATMGIKIFTKVYEDTNSCEVSSNRKYITEQFHKLMQEKNVKEITAIKRKRFVFTVENQEEMSARINDILDATPEVAVRSKAHSFFQFRKRFWVAWAIIWGGIYFLQELGHILEGERSEAMLSGAFGVLVILLSLANYWNARNTEDKLKDKGVL